MFNSKQKYNICSMFLYRDIENDIIMNVMSEGECYIISGGATGEIRLKKNITSLEELKQHWFDYVDINKF
ncbi:MAG: hypothetical protein DIZ80_07850 [endosymbiont of Galathealinum brachiosum]|uniref:Uncharacterized protein n=1 Tax=endosymbiont of Galathealinum brachiosum TaxID=2200906 RepID=A0A370DGJ4_9GAMM|nr:MAG: hypothetical protein DIZ80_07850 [endosymbiont of Galathealinum brachiosum]